MTNLEDFDQLFVGDPAEIEGRLEALLPAAQRSSNRSLYPQILSQIALAQAMRQKFTEAHQTLDIAESACATGDHLARARILLERGAHLCRRKITRQHALYSSLHTNCANNINTIFTPVMPPIWWQWLQNALTIKSIGIHERLH
jgi:hypothetical protein